MHKNVDIDLSKFLEIMSVRVGLNKGNLFFRTKYIKSFDTSIHK